LIKIIPSKHILNTLWEIRLESARLLYLLVFLFVLSCAGPSPTDIAKSEKGTLFPVEHGQNWGFIDRQGNVAIPIKYQGAVDFSEGRALIKENGKWGYINEWDIMVITPEYVEAHKFSEGFAVVKVDGAYGYINRVGKMVIEPNFEKVNPFSEGLASVKYNGEWGYINKKGEIKVGFAAGYDLLIWKYIFDVPTIIGMILILGSTGWLFSRKKKTAIESQNIEDDLKNKELITEK